jgi:hypothetical protein
LANPDTQILSFAATFIPERLQVNSIAAMSFQSRGKWPAQTSDKKDEWDRVYLQRENEWSSRTILS